MFRVMSYNIEHMAKLFSKNKTIPKNQNRINAIAKTIATNEPDILGIVCNPTNIKHWCKNNQFTHIKRKPKRP